MIPLDLNQFVDHFKSLNYLCYIQTETGQICLDLPVLDGKLPTFIRIYDTQDLFQFILILPITIEPGSVGSVARLLHILNKEIDLPGFCLDEQNNIVFYRMSIPALNGKVDKNLLDTMLKSMQNLAAQFIPIIAQAANGQLDLEQMLEQLKLKKSDADKEVN